MQRIIVYKHKIAPDNIIKTEKKLFFTMLKIRRVEEAIIQLYPAQEIRCPVHLCTGQEAIPAGVCYHLKKSDVVFGSHRAHGYYIAKGGNINSFMAELYGKATGCGRGKSGSQHFAAPEIGFWGSSAIVAGTVPIAVGAALSFAMQHKKSVVVVDFGDGATDEGVFYEALNFSALKRLPVIFICENNSYATHAHQLARQAKDNIVQRAQAFGVPAVRIDGNDVIEVFRACRNAVSRARLGKGPSLIECKTYRWLEHVGPNYDYNLGYRTEKELKEWMKKCPIKRFEKLLLKKGLITKTELAKSIKKIDSEIEKAVAAAKDSIYPSPSELLKDVYCV